MFNCVITNGERDRNNDFLLIRWNFRIIQCGSSRLCRWDGALLQNNKQICILFITNILSLALPYFASDHIDVGITVWIKLLFVCVCAHVQVLDERILHIPYVPSSPEPYYKFSGEELQPRPVGEENGVVVFTYNPISAVNYVSVLEIYFFPSFQWYVI